MSSSSLMNVLPHSFPGTLNLQNQTALDWGWQNLVAYGSNNLVVVIDPCTVQCMQTLIQHKHNVVKVRWATDNYHRSLGAPYQLRLASVDSSSQCVIWDVSEGNVLKEFNLGNKVLVDLQWLDTNDSCTDLLAVMLKPGVMIIWNAREGIRMSRFTFPDTIMAFTFSPFQPENLILQSNDCFIFVEDFHPSRTPASGGKKFYLTIEDSVSSSLKNRSDSRFQHRLVSSDDLQGKETKSLSDCAQICFSPACRYRLFLVYPREILILDTDLKQTVGVICSERNSSVFHQVMPCRQRDVLYCLHENGCVSVRIHQKLSLPSALPTSPMPSSDHGVHYDLHAHSEALRISKTCQVFMGALCPSSERQVAVLTSEGRVLFWQLGFNEVGMYSAEQGQEVGEGEEGLLAVMSARPVRESAVMVELERAWEEGEKEEEENKQYWQLEKCGWTLADCLAPHWFIPPPGSTLEYALLSLKLTLTQLWVGLPAMTSCVRMCPPLTTKNWLYYTPLVALGMTNGSILIYNLHSRHIVKELSVHNFPVRGVEWVNQTSFISYASAQPPPTSAGIRNEVAVINIQNGSVTFLKRPDTPDDAPSTAIDTIKISPLKHYLVVKYKDKPLEFWDLKTLTFLREMVSNPPTFSCLEWTPTTHRSKSKPEHAPSSTTVDFDMAMGADTKMAQALSKEHLTVMDAYGCMWQITIEGSKVKVINSTPTQTYLVSPACVTWKNSFMAAGDSEGTIYLHDGKHSKTVENTRMSVRKIRFAPGKGNSKLLVLFTTRLEIRDTTSELMISSLKWGPKDGGSVVVEDADWASSDKTVVVTVDGSVRVYDLSFQLCQSSFTVVDFRDAVFCPHAGPPIAALRLKTILTHQSWRSDYSLLSEDHEPISETIADQVFTKQLKLLPEEWCGMLLDASLGTPQRALQTALIYGDKYEVDFWSLSLHYILREKQRLRDPRYGVYKSAQPRNPTSDFICPDSFASISLASSDRGISRRSQDSLLGPFFSDPPSEESANGSQDLLDGEVTAMLQDCDLQTLPAQPPLDLCWDLLCDTDIFRRVQLERVAQLDSKRTTSAQTKRCSELLLLLGQTDRSVQLLLETESSSQDYYNCALKACLAATIRSSGVSQSTIKLVATNLIANSRLMDGVELLCLIDKQQDACRYLQTYGEWYHSTWLAKATLKERDCSDVFSKWVEYLMGVGVDQKSRGILVLLSLGNFWKVVETLHSMEHFDQAAIFLESCLEHKVVQVTKETTPLTQSVYLEYARHLLSVGLVRGFKHYCSKAGSSGKQLLEDYFKQQISSQSSTKSPTPVNNTSDTAPPLLVDLAP